MDEITTQREALRVIKRLGYLNKFSSLCDTYFLAHCVPGGEADDCPAIGGNAALRLSLRELFA